MKIAVILLAFISVNSLVRPKFGSYELTLEMLSLDNKRITNQEFRFQDKTYISDSLGRVTINVGYIISNCNNYKPRKCNDILNLKYLQISDKNGTVNQFKNKWRKYSKNEGKTYTQELVWAIVMREEKER